MQKEYADRLPKRCFSSSPCNQVLQMEHRGIGMRFDYSRTLWLRKLVLTVILAVAAAAPALSYMWQQDAPWARCGVRTSI